MKHFGGIHGDCDETFDRDRALEFTFFLCPGFSLLDLASAIEPLSLANRLSDQKRFN